MRFRHPAFALAGNLLKHQWEISAHRQQPTRMGIELGCKPVLSVEEIYPYGGKTEQSPAVLVSKDDRQRYTPGAGQCLRRPGEW